MSLEWCDNFSVYGLGNNSSAAVSRLLDGPYAQVGTGGTVGSGLVVDPDPSATGTVFSCGRAGGTSVAQLNGLRRVLSGTQTTVGQGARFWLSLLPTNSTNRIPILFQTRDVGNVALTTIMVQTTGALQIRSGSETGAIIGTTTGPVLVANAWQHVECKVLHSATVGTVEIRVEGVVVLNLTNVDTSTGGLACAQVVARNIQLSSSDVSNDLYVKDYVVWNGGGTANNNFIGTVFVQSLLPESDVALNWTPVGAVNGFSILDNSPPDDASYIEAGIGPIPGAYIATLTNLPANVTAVRAVMALVRARKVDGGDGNIQTAALSGVATALGANRPITAAFTYWPDIYEQDPATSAAWSPGAVNTMRLQLNRTT